MQRRDDIQKQVSAIREQIGSFREGLDKEFDKLEGIIAGCTIQHEEHGTKTEAEEHAPVLVKEGPRPQPDWRYTTLTTSKTGGKKRGGQFRFQMSFQTKFIKEEKLMGCDFLETEFDRENQRIYFNFHRDNGQRQRWALDTKGRCRTKGIELQQGKYEWLEKRFDEGKTWQCPIKTNEAKTGPSAHLRYYISIQEAVVYMS